MSYLRTIIKKMFHVIRGHDYRLVHSGKIAIYDKKMRYWVKIKGKYAVFKCHECGSVDVA